MAATREKSSGRSPVEDAPTTQEAASPPPAPQEKEGAKAWLQVLGGFLVFFNIWYVFVFPTSIA